MNVLSGLSVFHVSIHLSLWAVDKNLQDSPQSLRSRSKSGYNSLMVTPRVRAERKEGRITIQRRRSKPKN